MSAARPLQRELAALLAVTFLFPVVICLVLLPTPSVDIREHVNWGLNFPLFTWKHPPLEDWIVGLIALTGARDAWPYALVAQLLNFAALFYLFKIAKTFVGEHSAIPIVIAFCGSIYSSVAIPDSALNADQIQAPFWLGLIYHGLSAIRDDRWRDWILAGLFAALAVLAKYFAIPFVAAFVLAALLIPSTRSVLRRPGFYVAGLVCGLVLAIHVIPFVRWAQSTEGMLAFGLGNVESTSSFTRRLESLGNYVYGFPLFGLPFLLALGVVAWHREVRVVAIRREDPSAVFVATMVILSALILAACFVTGFRYRPRFGNPIMPLALLTLFAFLRIEPGGVRRLAQGTLIAWAVLVVGSIGLLLTVTPRFVRDPLDAATAIIRSNWDRQFACGPAYVVGGYEPGTTAQAPAAYGVGMNFGRSVIGLSPGDTQYAPWVDRQRLRDLGVVIVETPGSAPTSAFATAFSSATPPMTLSLTYRRSLRGQEFVLIYRFVPPTRCPEQ